MKTNDKLVWTTLLQNAALKRTKTPEGEGWLTFVELQTLTGFGRAKLNRMLQSEILDGTVDRFDGTIMGEKNRLQNQVWYRPVQVKKKPGARRPSGGPA